MPVLDTVVLFGAADERDEKHAKALDYMKRLEEEKFFLAGFALIEFDVVLKSRGYSCEERMNLYGLLLKNFPYSDAKVRVLKPTVLYLAARIEKETRLDYFDAGVAAEALQHDGVVVSSDEAFDRVVHLKRIW